MKAHCQHPDAISLAVAVVLVVGLSLSSAAGDGTLAAPYALPEVSSHVALDGVLDEALWGDALALELAYETSPGDNVPARVGTRLLLCSNRTHLFAAFVAEDPDPAAIRATLSDRDQMFDDDRVSITLDTFNDQRRGYMFFANPLGVQGDALDSSGDGAGDPAWDAIWGSAGRVEGNGYVVEMAIPFSSLRFQRTEGRQIWGVGAGRKYSRDSDYRFSLSPRDRNDPCYLCQVVKVSGFAGASPGRNIEIDPTVSGVATQVREDFPAGDLSEAGKEFEAGVTARWGLTPNLVLSGTANPDFSQVESDAFQLSVNELFALYYDEKRPFFQEGSEYFDTNLSIVYTRAIADPAWGVKLTGKESGNGLGLFVAEDEVTNLMIPGSQGSAWGALDQDALASVLRYRRDIGATSNVGVVATDRRGDDYESRLAGVDGHFALTQSDRVMLQVVTSRTDYPDGLAEALGQPRGEFGGVAYDVLYDHDSENYEWWLAYRELEEGFRADLGFHPQVDLVERRMGLKRIWRAESGNWYESIAFGGGYVHRETHDGELLESFADGWLNYSGPNRIGVDLYGYVGKRGYGGTEYESGLLQGSVTYWPCGTVALSGGAHVEEAVDYANERPGREYSVGLFTDAKLGERLGLALSLDHQWMDVDEGRLYSANVGYVRAAYQFTRRAFLRGLVLYMDEDLNGDLYEEGTDLESQELASQILFSYKVNPQTVLYLGYSDSYSGGSGVSLTQSDRTLFVKLGYAWVL